MFAGPCYNDHLKRLVTKPLKVLGRWERETRGSGCILCERTNYSYTHGSRGNLVFQRSVRELIDTGVS